jgi:arylsulfatase A-like enzyme/tetratricopeptide (TPR) repeat protein
MTVAGAGTFGIRGIVAGLASIAIAACGGRDTTPALSTSSTSSTLSLSQGQLRGANVLLVTIDTLRRDRLGAYGSTAGLTPTLDRLAASGILYTHAYAHVPMTLPAHTSIFTGRAPRSHGVHDNGTFRLDDRVPTLATMLKTAGYRTGAFVGAFVLDARFGLNRGFDEYDDRYPHDAGAATFRFTERRAAEVVKPAGDWILRGDSGDVAGRHGPWFAWVHLFDPHAPYEAPPEYRAGRAPYDAEVAYADAMLGQFLDRLRGAHALDHSLILVTADHGESLGEHGETTHGLFAYNSTLAVPLMLGGPSIPAGRIEAPVAHADILPTLLDLAGVALPSGLDGRSLVTVPPADRAIEFEALDASLTRGWAPLTGIVAGNWKYIELPVPELYNVDADPREQTNLAARESAHRDALASALGRMDRSPAPSAPSTPSTPSTPSPGSTVAALDADAAARLRALGYAGGAAAPRKDRYTSADDPKTLAPLNERFNAALEAFNAGRASEALAGFTAILRERSEFLTARTSAATVLLSAGRAADAVTLLREAPPGQSGSPQLLAKLGAALREADDLHGAAAAFERARAGGDQNPDLFNDLGVVYGRLGRTAKARAMFAELLRRDPGAAGTWYNLGILELATSKRDRAAGAFEHAVKADPAYGEAWQGLGAALVSANTSGAIDAWRHAERLRPGDYDLLFNLGMLLSDTDHPADALPYLQRFVSEAPRDRYARDLRRVRAAIAKASR